MAQIQLILLLFVIINLPNKVLKVPRELVVLSYFVISEVLIKHRCNELFRQNHRLIEYIKIVDLDAYKLLGPQNADSKYL